MAAFYLDNDVTLRLIEIPQAAGHDAVTARALRLEAANDDEHLLVAAQRVATLVTHNAKDFTLLHGAWLRWSAAWGVTPRHEGIVILPQPTASERARGAIDAAELTRLILELVAQDLPQPNQLWQWQRARGWTLHQ